MLALAALVGAGVGAGAGAPGSSRCSGAAADLAAFNEPAAQIAVVVDASGRKVYVNTSTPPSRVDWMLRSFHRNNLSATSGNPADFEQLVETTAGRFQVDPGLIQAIIRVESDYDPKAVSSKGAMGLMQLIPETAQRFGVANPFDPRQNVEGGTGYLRYLLDHFGGDLSLSLAAYNAGEHSVERWGGIPAFPETQSYVRKVTTVYRNGNAATARKAPPRPPAAPIVTYVDGHGVVHYTNVE